REHLQVYLRVRPFTTAEISNGESQESVIFKSPDTVILKPPSLSLLVGTDKILPQAGQRFTFSRVYGPDTTQKDLFDGTVKDLVKHVLEGGNSLVFTYGATNAGKTFTFLGPDTDPGILPRSLDVIFNFVGEQGYAGMSIKPHRQEFTRLTVEQQTEEALFKRNPFRKLKEVKCTYTLNHFCILSCVSFHLQIELNSSNLLNSTNTALREDRISLDLKTHFKFSVWVSFCEIYNENIHDLLEVIPSGASRRTVLRLSQDIMGRAFVKDLCWVQVNNAEEAYKILIFGKKNQSFSATRLNHLSSRSHSIFSIRVLRIEDVESPKVHTVSELSLCDLAGSERCAKTQNTGERLKEAGNINTSLLILGKCINAMRNNKQAKLLQHVPFRESKLTHYLQGFFCGRGKVSMIVNINQCASMYDETLNVLKLSAVAQKVVILSSKPPPIMPQKSVVEVSFVEAEKKSGTNTTNTSAGSYSSLEDVQEDDEYQEGKSLMDGINNEEEGDENKEKFLISKHFHLQKQVALLRQLQLRLKKAQEENVLIEAQVREEVSQEFTKLFSEMQDDFNERLLREREILEERAEKRLEIFKNLINKMATSTSDSDAQEMEGIEGTQEKEVLSPPHEGEAQEEASSMLDSLKKSLEAEKTARLEMITALEEAEERGEKHLNALSKERNQNKELQSALEVQREEVSRLVEEGGQREQEASKLREQINELTAKLEFSQHQSEVEMLRAKISDMEASSE
uniref:Kinesin-like protein n=1 Tax=Tetraodon nigroviridis TaxID=99883 RepID=H3D796_TETNG